MFANPVSERVRAAVNTVCMLCTGLCFCVFVGCGRSLPTVNRAVVDREVRGRTDASVARESHPGEVRIPPGIDTATGLTEENAAAIALWNNAAFQATLADLGVARGDLIQAGLLANPQLNLLFPPLGSKQLEWTIFAPLEPLVLRKYRVEVADRDFQRVCEDLVQNGLNVVRDARIGLIDLQLAEDRRRLAVENVAVVERLVELAGLRVDAGGSGELELVSARLEAGQRRAELAGLEQAVRIAETRLRLILGLAAVDLPLRAVASPRVNARAMELDEVVTTAIRDRPDVRAARIAVQAAERRLELNRRSFLRVDGVLDGNNGGAGPNNMGPGLRFEVPIFNRNEGLVIRSQWTVDQARHNYHAVHDRALTEVRVALGSFAQAGGSLGILRRDVLPELQRVQQLAETAWADGGDSYVVVLQTTSQVLTARQREQELQADLRRAAAELSRSAGRRIDALEIQEIDLPVLPSASTPAAEGQKP